MSQEDIDEDELTEADYQFFARLATPFILNIQNTDRRTKAAAWLSKITEIDEVDLKIDFLKLLMFAMQRKALYGPFGKFPPETELTGLPQNRALMDVSRRITYEEKRKMATTGEPLPYMTAISGDFKQYAVAQPIAKFGAHCYYAVSGSPITEWKHPEKGTYRRSVNLDHRLFDMSAPSRSHVPVGREEFEDEKGGVCPDEDVYKWIDKDTEFFLVDALMEGDPDDDLDPDEGLIEIDQHLAILEQELRGQKCNKANAYSQNVAEVFGENFEGAVATAKSLRTVDSEYSDGMGMSKRDLSMGMSFVGRDKSDNSFVALYKSGNVLDEQPEVLRKKQSPPAGRHDKSDYDVGYDEGFRNGQNNC